MAACGNGSSPHPFWEYPTCTRAGKLPSVKQPQPQIRRRRWYCFLTHRIRKIPRSESSAACSARRLRTPGRQWRHCGASGRSMREHLVIITAHSSSKATPSSAAQYRMAGKLWSDEAWIGPDRDRPGLRATAGPRDYQVRSACPFSCSLSAVLKETAMLMLVPVAPCFQLGPGGGCRGAAWPACEQPACLLSPAEGCRAAVLQRRVGAVDDIPVGMHR